MTATAFSLPIPTRLEEFELTGVLGEGGFSVVYTALDHFLERTVAIKEYMPGAIATRLPNGTVLPKSPKHEDTFKAGLASFLNEARLLAKFMHPALVYIYRVWEQNGTAYMAMQYCVGKTLRQISQAEPETVKDERWLKITFAPILDALELLHAQNCFHRDISPDNILVLQNGEPVLLDFGAARQIIGDMTQALTVILRPGFAPVEQYADDSSLQQGPWTDVYSVGAVLYYLLMGKPPVASVARLVKDPMAKLADSNDFPGVSRSFRGAIDRALAVHPDQRIQSIPDLREALQLPTFKPDRQAGRSLGDFPEVAKQPADEMRILGTASADLNGSTTTSVSSSSSTASVEVSSSLDDRETNVAAEASHSSATAKSTNSIRWPLGFQNPVSWGIGVIVVALVAAFGLLHKPVTAVNKETSITDAVPVEDASEPPASVASSTPLSVDNQAANATAALSPADQASTTPQNSIPETPIPETPVVVTPTANVQELSPAFKGDTQAVSNGNLENPLSPGGNNNNMRGKTAAEPTQMVLPHESVPTSPYDVSSAAAAPTKTKRQMAVSSESEPAAMGEQRPTATPAFTPPNKMPTVRLAIKPWGQVTVDGRPQGVSPPLTRLPVSPGDHVVVLTNGDFPPVTIPITVPQKGEVVVSHQFGIAR